MKSIFPNPVEVFCMIEASPPDILLGGIAKMDKNAEKISEVLTASGKLAVFCASNSDSIKTAGIFRENPRIAAQAINTGLALHGMDNAAASVADRLGVLAACVGRSSGETDHLAMVLVVNPQTAGDIQDAAGMGDPGKLDLSPLGLSHFSYK